MKDFFRRNSLFLSLCLVFVATLGGVLLGCDKGTLHLAMNPEHNAIMDGCMRYYTIVGEWVPYVVVALLLFYKAGWSLFALADILLSGLIGQGLKYAFDTDRPLTWFGEHMPDVQLQLVEGVRMSSFYSFPSGHTITFFALFFTLAIIVVEENYKNKNLWVVVCFLMAVLGGYSRIYLSQHFAEDIWGGTIIGVVTTILLYWGMYRLKDSKLWNWRIQNIVSQLVRKK